MKATFKQRLATALLFRKIIVFCLSAKASSILKTRKTITTEIKST